jgi:hypothetical protein
MSEHNEQPLRRAPVIIAGWLTGAAISVGMWTIMIRVLHP